MERSRVGGTSLRRRLRRRGIGLLRVARRHVWRDPRPTPLPVVVSFGVFTAALLVVSTLLLARNSPLPWQVTGDRSTAIGLMFLGAAAYFVYGLVDRRWENAGGQLAQHDAPEAAAVRAT